MDKIYCHSCHKEVIDVDHYLGTCDKCLGLDDKGWKAKIGFTPVQAMTRPQLLSAENRFLNSFSGDENYIFNQ